MKVVCISGKAQHGKDTLAKFMQEELESRGERVLTIHYADLLKFYCVQYFGWDGVKDEYGRSMLQYVGQKVRKTSPDFWVDQVIRFLCLFGDEFDFVLIPDCRYENEIDLISAWGFDVTTVRVSRGNFDNGLTPVQEAHISETALDDWCFDYNVANVEGLDNLRDCAVNLADVLYEEEQAALQQMLTTTIY